MVKQLVMWFFWSTIGKCIYTGTLCHALTIQRALQN